MGIVARSKPRAATTADAMPADAARLKTRAHSGVARGRGEIDEHVPRTEPEGRQPREGQRPAPELVPRCPAGGRGRGGRACDADELERTDGLRRGGRRPPAAGRASPHRRAP